jgi:hypothetical protein
VGSVQARAFRARVAQDAAKPRGRGPAPLALARRSSSCARVSHVPTRSRASRYRDDGGAGTSRTARSCVASRDAARRVDMPATLEPAEGQRPRARLWSSCSQKTSCSAGVRAATRRRSEISKSKLSVRGRKVPNTQAAARVGTRPRARGAGSARRRVRVRFALADTTTAVPRVASLERSGGPSPRGVRA